MAAEMIVNMCSPPFSEYVDASGIEDHQRTGKADKRPVHLYHSLHFPYFSIERTGLHVQTLHSFCCGDLTRVPHGNNLVKIGPLNGLTAPVDALLFGDGDPLPLPL